jgi:2-polyprenyl-6-methoxyphenol hydroxylase-like FAD-dependent oxidoreductase
VSIAGAGLSGLTAAAALAQRGFEVRVFERNDTLREFGAGIYLKDNSLPVLDELGAGERVAASGERLVRAQIIDEKQRVIVSRDVSRERLIVVLRSELHGALRDSAEKAGVEIVTGAPVSAARPDGTLIFADGSEVTSDLVIAADGVRSRIRESLGLTRSYRVLQDGATRLLIPRMEENVAAEYWAGSRRIGIAPCSADLSYVFMIGPESDARGTRVPVDREHWLSHFPHLEGLLDRIPEDAGVHHAHEHVVCKRWTAGKVAIIGDAAHAQPPNFGQGAGVAIASAWELARTVAESDDVPGRLLDWERRARPTADVVQKLTTLYSHAGYYWPAPALGARAALFHWLSQVPATAHQWEFWWRGGTEAPQPRFDEPEEAGS